MTADATAKALEEARRNGDIKRVGFTTEAAKPYYEAIKESDEAQEKFLGNLSTADLQRVLSDVAGDDRNLMGLAPRFASNRA